MAWFWWAACPPCPWQTWPWPWASPPLAPRDDGLKSPLQGLESDDDLPSQVLSPPLPHSLLWLPLDPSYNENVRISSLSKILQTCIGDEQCLAWGGGGTLSTSTPFIFISFLYFILLFWNQILICLSVKLNMAAISIRLMRSFIRFSVPKCHVYQMNCF